MKEVWMVRFTNTTECNASCAFSLFLSFIPKNKNKNMIAQMNGGFARAWWDTKADRWARENHHFIHVKWSEWRTKRVSASNQQRIKKKREEEINGRKLSLHVHQKYDNLDGSKVTVLCVCFFFCSFNFDCLDIFWEIVSQSIFISEAAWPNLFVHTFSLDKICWPFAIFSNSFAQCHSTTFLFRAQFYCIDSKYIRSSHNQLPLTQITTHKTKDLMM